MNGKLFFNGLFEVIFNTYFVFVYTALLLLSSPAGNEHKNLNTCIFSWLLLIFCVVFVPMIIVYAAAQPVEIRKSKKFLHRFGTLYKS